MPTYMPPFDFIHSTEPPSLNRPLGSMHALRRLASSLKRVSLKQEPAGARKASKGRASTTSRRCTLLCAGRTASNELSAPPLCRGVELLTCTFMKLELYVPVRVEERKTPGTVRLSQSQRHRALGTFAVCGGNRIQSPLSLKTPTCGVDGQRRHIVFDAIFLCRSLGRCFRYRK